MEEHIFLCGLSQAQRAAHAVGTRLQINGHDKNIILKIEEVRKKYLADIPNVLTDLLEIAGYVFAADNSVTRGGPALRNMGRDWRRSFRLVIGVRELGLWSSTELRHALRELLGFLSDDSWQFQFVPLDAPTPWPEYFDFSRNEDDSGASNVVLFSGGLDSLAGALHELRNANQRIVLVSHKSSPIAVNRQTALARELRDRFGSRVFHVPVRVNMTEQQPPVEDTQRTRSFLFTAIATVVANLAGAHRIRFFENGIMSVNLPISAQVVGTRATRTTHPHSLRLLEKLVRLVLANDIVIDNPFVWMTKAEVIQVLRAPVDQPLIAQSISCSRTREVTSMHWHCGTCAQCLQRRIGTLGAGLSEADPKEGYAVDFLTDPRDDGEDRVMAVDMVRSALEFRRLSDQGFLHRYAGEFSRLGTSVPGTASNEAARKFLDLFKRHGETVRAIFIEATQTNSAALVDQTLPPDCLLRMVFERPDSEIDDSRLESAAHSEPLDRDGNPNVDVSRSTEIVLAVDVEKKQVRIAGASPITGSTAYRMMRFLAERHREDLMSGLLPRNHRTIDPKELASLISLQDGGGIRSTLRRLRKSLRTEFEMKYGLTLSRDAIVENVHGRGYRINPDVKIVSVAELEKLA